MEQKIHTADFQPLTLRLDSEEDLIKSFRPKDQRKVIPPRGIRYPLDVEHYYVWREPSGVYMYMIFQKPNWDRPRGVIFRRAETAHLQSAKRLCDWCLNYGGSDAVGMLGVRLNSKTSVGMMLCQDLSCARNLETVAELSGKSFEKLAKDLYEKIGRFYEGMMNEPADTEE